MLARPNGLVVFVMRIYALYSLWPKRELVSLGGAGTEICYALAGRPGGLSGYPRAWYRSVS